METDFNPTIARLLLERATHDPEGNALLAPHRQPVNYRRLYKQVSDTVQAFNAHGIHNGDTVALVLPNGPEMAACFLAVAAAATCAPLNPSLKANEFEFYFSELLPKALIVQEGIDSPVRAVARALGVPLIEMRPLVQDPAGTFTLQFSGVADRPVQPPVFAEAHDVALILHTSGTTSRPKMVPLTHANLCCSARNIKETLALRSADRCLNVMPLFHIHGLVGAVLSSLTAGSSIVCLPGFVAPDFWKRVDEYRPTWYTAVPTMHQSIASQAAQNLEIVGRSRLRVIRSSSSALSPRLMAQLEEIVRVPIIEAYSMTEAAHQMTSNPLPPGVRKPGSVGLPAGPAVSIVDGAGTPLGPNEEGDVVVRGPSVMRGYLSGSAANDAAFVSGWFRTGDRGRLDGDGYLFLTGRIKEIINRGGEKISPREIDEVLVNHPSVAAALAFAYPDPRLGEDVAAVVVLHEHASASERELREFASLTLSDFKVPRRIVFMDEIPKGPTGKPQRIGLASVLGVTGADMATEGPTLVAPSTAGETMVLELWCEALGRKDMGVHDNFFELGGDSILAAQIVVRILESADVQLSMIDFLEIPTIAGVAMQIARLPRMAALVARGIAPVSRGGLLPLSFAQSRMWFLSQLDQDSPSYNVTLAIRLDGALDRQALEWSLHEVVRRHETLRTTFPSVDGQPGQVVSDTGALPLTILDVDGALVEDGESEFLRIVASTASVPFDLASGPLIRATLVRFSAERHLLQLDMHHIVADAWSRRILLQELTALYRSYRSAVRKEANELPPLSCQYADFSAWQHQSVTPAIVEAGAAFWRQQLANAPTHVRLFANSTASPRHGGVEASETLRLSSAFDEKLRDFSRSNGVSLFMTLAASFQTLLYRLGGQEDIVVGFPVSGRNRPDVENLVGLFVNTLLLRADLSENPTFESVLRRIRETALAVYSQQDLPFEKIVEALRPERSGGRIPLFNVMLDFVDRPYADETVEGLRFTPLDVPEPAPNLDLVLYIKQQGNALSMRVHYRRGLLKAESASNLLHQFRRLLEQVVGNPHARVRSYEVEWPTEAPLESALIEGATAPPMAQAERRRPLQDWNDTGRDYPSCGVHQLVEEQAQRRPDAVAVIEGARRVTYGELDRRANGIARQLRACGVTRDVPVGVYLERSLEMIVGWLAVLKAGGAYVPLDPTYPPARLAFMTQDTGIGVMLTRRTLAGQVPGCAVAVVCVDTDADESDAGADADADHRAVPPSQTTGDDLAYVMYTSGSTGEPKGVEITHRGIVRLLCGVDYATFSETQVWLHLATPAFDASTLEIWGALIHGARCVVVPAGVPTTGELATVIARHGVTTAWMTASLFNAVVDEAPATLAPLQQLLIGGEALSVAHVRRAYEALPALRLINGYGPTEGTTFTCCYAIPRDLPTDVPSIPIGRPIGNTRVYVLDDRMAPVPIGVPGELYIGGDGLARGYRHQPALTAERFVAVLALGEARVYKTGDRVRYRLDGTLDFLGRLDQQVKIRGFRIEVGEVEFALEAHPDVQRAAVAPVGDAAVRHQHLVAYVVSVSERSPSRDELRAFLSQSLPEYMLPSWFVYLPSLPLTPSGKLDRSALPRQSVSSLAVMPEFIAPRTEMEETLAAIFSDVLNLLSRGPIGAQDNFFDLGGHSLLTVKLLARVHQKFGKSIPLRKFYDAPTVAALASELTVEQSGRDVISRRDGSAPSRLSFAQERLCFWDRLAPDSTLYNVPLAMELHGPLNPDALQRALNTIVARHATLRTRISDVGGTPMQMIAPAGRLHMVKVDLRLPRDEDSREALRHFLENETSRRFDLASELLLRAKLGQLGESEHVLALIFHHIAADAWSLDIFFRELRELYEAYTDERELELAELPIQYTDYAEWQREWLTDAELGRQLRYWTQQLEGLTLLQLPADRSRPAVQTYRGMSEQVELGERLSQSLRQVGGREGVMAVLLAAFGALLFHYSNQEDIAIGVPVANRTRAETENLIGFFVNTVVVRMNLGGQPTFRELLGRVQESLLSAREHQDVPFEKVVEALRPERSSSYTPLFQVMFAPQDGLSRTFEMGGVRAQVRIIETGTAKFDLTLKLSDDGRQVGGAIEYSTDLYDAETIRRMVGHYVRLLEGFVTNPDQAIAAAPLMAEAEKRQLLRNGNDNRRDHPSRGVQPPVHSTKTEAQISSLDSIDVELLEIWRAVLDLPTMSVTDDFFGFGGNSLTAVRLFARIEENLGVKLPISALFQAPTVERLAAMVRAAEEATGCLVPIRGTGSERPFFCVHGQGGGVFNFRSLGRALGIDQPMYGLQAVGLDRKSPPHTSVEQMASHYVAEVRGVQPVGPYRLGGWSLGGIIAVEMARQLYASGQAVDPVILLDVIALDAPVPFPMPAWVRHRFRAFLRGIYKHSRRWRSMGWRAGYAYASVVGKRRWRKFLTEIRPVRNGRQGLTPPTVYEAIGQAHWIAAQRYHPQPYDGGAILFRTQHSVDEFSTDPSLGWGRLIRGGLEICDVPGDHFTILTSPHLQVLAGHMMRHFRATSAAAPLGRTR